VVKTSRRPGIRFGFIRGTLDIPSSLCTGIRLDGLVQRWTRVEWGWNLPLLQRIAARWMAGWREPLPTTSFFFRLFCFDPATVSVEESFADHFGIALFSALEQTHYALVACDSEWVTRFLRRVFDWMFAKEVFLQRCFLGFTLMVLREAATASVRSVYTIQLCTTSRPFKITSSPCRVTSPLFGED